MVAGFVLLDFRVTGFSAVAVTGFSAVADAPIAGTMKGARATLQSGSVPFYTDLRTWTANPYSEFTGEHVKLRGGAGIRGWNALLRRRVSGVTLAK